MDTTEIKELFEKTLKNNETKITKLGSFHDARYFKHTGMAFTEKIMMNTKSGFLYTLKKLYWMFEGDIHKLDGPAVLTDAGSITYSIDHVEYTEEDFWEHPMVLQNKLDKILEL